MVAAVLHQLEAEHKLLEQKLKDTEDNRVKLEANMAKLTNDHNEEVKRLKKERDDVEAKAESSELNWLPYLSYSDCITEHCSCNKSPQIVGQRLLPMSWTSCFSRQT